MAVVKSGHIFFRETRDVIFPLKNSRRKINWVSLLDGFSEIETLQIFQSQNLKTCLFKI